MNSEKNLMNVEEGAIRPCECKNRQTDTLFKYLVIAWLVCLTVWFLVQTYNARDCTCLHSGGTGRTENVEESKVYTFSLQKSEQDRSTPKDDHVAREKRSVREASQSIYSLIRLYLMLYIGNYTGVRFSNEPVEKSF